MNNVINVQDFVNKSNCLEIFGRYGLMGEDGSIIDRTENDNPDPNKYVDMYYELVGVDQRFIYKQQDILAQEKGWVTSEQMAAHIVEISKNNNLGVDYLTGFLMETDHGNLVYIVDKVNDVNYIDLSELSLIETPEQFFSQEVTKIAFIHMEKMDIVGGGMSDKMIEAIVFSEKGNGCTRSIRYNGNVYLMYFLKGSPENMYLNFKDGVSGKNVYMKGDWDLQKAIEGKCLFNFTEENDKLNGLTMNTINDDEYLIEHFIKDKNSQVFNILQCFND
jgi:hypothetical protein